MTRRPVAVIVVDDHSLVRESVVRAVGSEPGFSVVAEGANGTEALHLVARHEPDVLLLDITMPGVDGLEAAAQIKRTHPGTSVLILTMHDDEASIRAALSADVDGYVCKSAELDELLLALKTVAEGDSYIASGLSRLVMQLASGQSRSPLASLTPRELEVLRALAGGSRTADIADAFHLSVKTVKNHLTTIYAKLGVETAAQAVGEAYRLGIADAHWSN